MPAKADLPITLTPQGSIDLSSVEHITVKQFETWIRGRLSGEDPFLTLHEDRGESRHQIFIYIAHTTDNKDVFYRICWAIGNIINDLSNTQWDGLSLSDRDLFTSTLRLIEYISPESDSQTPLPRSLGTILFRLAKDRVCLRATSPSGTRAHIRILYALGICQHYNDWLDTKDDFWKREYREFPAAAFGALTRWEPKSAVKLLPDLIDRVKDKRQLEAEISYLSENLTVTAPQVSTEVWKDEIEKAFEDSPHWIRTIFSEVAESLGLPSLAERGTTCPIKKNGHPAT